MGGKERERKINGWREEEGIERNGRRKEGRERREEGRAEGGEIDGMFLASLNLGWLLINLSRQKTENKSLGFAFFPSSLSPLYFQESTSRFSSRRLRHVDPC